MTVSALETKTAVLLASATPWFEAAPDATVIVDAAGQIQLINRQTEALFGYPRSELVGQRVEMLMPVRYAAAHGRHRAAFHAEPRVRPMSEVRQELLGRRKDGTEFPADINLSPVTTADGLLVIATIRDISRRRQMEQELREREALLRSIADNVPHAYLSVVNRDFTVGYTTGQEFKLQQLDPAAFVGKYVREVFQPYGDDTVATVFAAYERTFAGAEQSFELRIGEQDQLYKTVPMASADGAIEKILVVVENVTPRKQAEAALRESEERSRSILDSIFAFVALLTTDGRLLDCNDAPLRAMAMRKVDVLGRSILDGPWFSPAVRDRVQTIIARVAAGEFVREEVPVRTGDGTLLEMESAWSPLRDASGRVTQIVASGVDVSERNRAQFRIGSLMAWQKAILDTAPYLIISTTPEGLIQTFNAAAGRMLGYAPEEVIGRVTPEIIHERAEVEERARLFSTELGETIAPGFEVFVARARRDLPNEYAWTYVRKDGSRFPVMVSVTALRTVEGGITGFLAMARDITEQRRLEGELRHMQKMEAVGQLSAGIAHDFNNILTVIQGQISLLEIQHELPPIARVSLTEVREAAERAANLTRQLLTFSRRQSMRPRPLDLNVVVTNMTRMLQRILGEHIGMELRLSPHDAALFADPGMIEQILLNLAVNSRDAMPRGGRLSLETAMLEFDDTITARVPQARAGSFVCLTATDTGCGIPPHVLPRIFEPFFTTKEPGRGTGLGLATVYGIVQQHEGWITVDSEVGRGTTFRIHLPRYAGKVIDLPPPAAALRDHSGTETILIVEDEPPLRALIANLLGRLGYQVLAAASGPQALALWRERNGAVDLLVTDLVMPDGMSGFELGERLKRESSVLRIIYTSGYSPEIAGRYDKLVEGQNFLAKPFEMEQLLRAIRDSLATGPR